jgi:hypothetical protein
LSSVVESKISEDYKTVSPVLFLVFNRPETTQEVFEAIRKAKPRRLYIAADGPRADRAGEIEKCQQVRLIATNIDWDCEIQTLFRDANVGCRRAVSEAISWFFKHEEQGIILEDDCNPVNSFFRYCDELLIAYSGDKRVGQISGFNRGVSLSTSYSYFFSQDSPIWGWATWRDRWDLYKDDVADIAALSDYHEYTGAKRKFLLALRSARGEIDTWDYLWTFALTDNNLLSTIPSTNLITNIGFGGDATHTGNPNDPRGRIVSAELVLPLIHPPSFAPISLSELSDNQENVTKRRYPIRRLMVEFIRSRLRF